MEGHYNVTEFCDVPSTPAVESCGIDPELSGVGYHGGFLAGYNYQMDDFVLGVEGDYAFGGETASNEEPDEMTFMSFDSIATLRMRAGIAFDDTLVYATGGVAFIDTTFSSTDAPTGSGLSVEDSQWLTGYAVGGGIEHAFTDVISGRLEYMYIGAPNATYEIDNGTAAGIVEQEFESIHTIRAALTYNFSM
jgi:outer membrane immunogenic protein